MMSGTFLVHLFYSPYKWCYEAFPKFWSRDHEKQVIFLLVGHRQQEIKHARAWRFVNQAFK